MTISNRQKAILHLAKGKLGLTDNEYRSCLVHLAGVESSVDLDQDGFEAVMGFFEWRGFRPLLAEGPSYGNRPGMATFAQLELIRCLWREYTRGAAGEQELNKWLLNSFRLSSLRFVDMKTARKLITALKAMKQRQRSAA
ncbi:regulatory protein GemA [Paenirhodobacter populi]|uniref:Regulatory protein GemA n=1 Tax=Paenirhodobacter populi TaxID=2306993 RepID=A0A443JSF2_9RHOB|nr:regulatory protein GemA [Sinirhodobacter populi]RWR12731.1 regulatory protein GemA [Sinirhodobacter populi]RWR23458.1 regulatory protein GemA [Sinirhodobacter populi]